MPNIEDPLSVLKRHGFERLLKVGKIIVYNVGASTDVTTATAPNRIRRKKLSTGAALTLKQNHILKKMGKVRTTAMIPTLKQAYIQRMGKNGFRRKGPRAMTMKVLKTRILTNGWGL